MVGGPGSNCAGLCRWPKLVSPPPTLCAPCHGAPHPNSTTTHTHTHTLTHSLTLARAKTVAALGTLLTRC